MTLYGDAATLSMVGWAAGSVTGRNHLKSGRNNQDAVAVEAVDARFVAVVTDGCGSGRASETGARLGAQFLARHYASRAFPDAQATAIPQLLAYLEAVALPFGSGADRRARIADHLLFTFLVTVVDASHIRVVGVGDGLVRIGPAAKVLTSGPENAPPYAAYELSGVLDRPVNLRVETHFDAPIGDLDFVAIATDGAHSIPEETIDQLISQARRSKNPYTLQRNLTVLRDRSHRLHDDTSLALIWRTS